MYSVVLECYVPKVKNQIQATKQNGEVRDGIFRAVRFINNR